MTTTTAVKTPAWMESAVCARRDPELWYPDPGGDHAPAITICRTCPVTVACLTWALHIEATTIGPRYGIWGGTTPTQRAHLAAGAVA